MNEEELLALETLILEQLREIGREDLADNSNYLYRDPDTGEPRVRELRLRVVEMLKLFERSMAVQDRKTYDDALAIMRDALPPDQAPRGALFIPIIGSRDAAPVDLARAPELSDLRDRILSLAARLADPGATPSRG